MFGFGTKKWKNNEEWFKEVCVNLNVVYYGWIMWCTYLFQDGNPRKIGSLKELYDDVLTNPITNSFPSGLHEVISRGKGIGYDRQIKTSAIVASQKLNWFNKNKPTSQQYEAFKGRQLPFIEMITKLIIKYDEFTEICTRSRLLSSDVDLTISYIRDTEKLHSNCINYLQTDYGSQLFNDFEIIKKTANEHDKFAKFNW